METAFKGIDSGAFGRGRHGDAFRTWPWWGGAGGTYMWVDPAQDMVVVFVMQSPKQRLHRRAVIRDLVDAAIVQ